TCVVMGSAGGFQRELVRRLLEALVAERVRRDHQGDGARGGPVAPAGPGGWKAQLGVKTRETGTTAVGDPPGEEPADRFLDHRAHSLLLDPRGVGHREKSQYPRER